MMKHVFQRKGDFWDCVFAQKQCFVQNRVGMHYYRELLGLKADQSIGVTELVNRVNGVAVVELGSPARDVVNQAHAAGEVFASGTYRPDYVMSKHQIAGLKARLEQKQEEAESQTDGQQRAELIDEIKAISKFMEEARSQHRFTDTETRNRTRVKNALERARRGILKVHPELARHLKQSIRTGFVCSYRPERPMEWTL